MIEVMVGTKSEASTEQPAQSDGENENISTNNERVD